jgi:Na+-transporting NADH:ubiquinone oxidoreductase subunit C
MSSNAKSIIFAFITCLVASLLLTTAATALKEKQQRNILIDRQKNILKAADLLETDKKYGADEIFAIYSKSIKNVVTNAEGEIISKNKATDGELPVYLCVVDGKVDSYIMPIETKGLWGTIRGYLAIENDGVTIKGFTVYQHVETPGLGGEIEKDWFQQNFVGKKIIDRDGEFVSVGIVKGKVSDQIAESDQGNYIDGISGATLTSKMLSTGIKDILTKYEPVSIKFRLENKRK